jgi:long-subunit fatty acid transport protein
LSPSGSLGVQWDVAPQLTLGATVQGPTYIWGSGTLTATLPTNQQLTGAQLVGSSIETSFWLPPVVGVGASWHPTRQLEIEAALDVELWSIHDTIDLTPSNVALETAAGTKLPLAAMHIAQAFHTSVSPAIGGEWHLGALALAAGVAYETSAAPASTVSVLAIDANKVIVGLGGGYAADGWQIGLAVGYAYFANVNVTLADARELQLQPLRTPQTVYVNAGEYSTYDVIAGFRAARTF